MLELDNPKLSLSKQCQLLDVTRSTYYRLRGKAERESDENLQLMRLIDEEYTRHPYYGSRKMRDWLNRNGYRVNRKRVRRLMKKVGLRCVAPAPNTSKPAPEHKIYPYLLRDVQIDRPN